uniref:Si:dkey-191g9.5 n=1 Tax=Takifugu rubripes TaxID=31033 RepID=A0A674NEC6_TAKRU
HFPGNNAAVDISRSGILPSLAQVLQAQSNLHCQVALLVAEMAREAAVRELCIDAGLVKALVPHLNSNNPEMLLNTGRAIGRICFDNSKQQSVTDSRATAATTSCDCVSDVLKLQFSESAVPEALSEMIQDLQGGSDPHDLCSIKIASNLIVSLLLGDESMQKCFAEGSGPVYRDVISWLQCSNTQLQLSGALAIANFARNDSNCVKMLDLGVVPHILTMLEQHVDEGDVSVQHAGLSALRNLAIPATNKVRMLDNGVTDRIKTLLRSDMPPVQFKLLGTLRMMVDGQEEATLILGRDPVLLARVMEWCEAKDHAGVRGEACRLLAALIRHSRSPDVVRAVLHGGGVQHLISMATSEHVIMQNEALVALTIAAATDLGTGRGGAYNTVYLNMIGAYADSAPCVCLDSGSIQERLSKLLDHSNSNISSQAASILTLLEKKP